MWVLSLTMTISLGKEDSGGLSRLCERMVDAWRYFWKRNCSCKQTNVEGSNERLQIRDQLLFVLLICQHNQHAVQVMPYVMFFPCPSQS